MADAADVGFAWASIAGLDVLAAMVERPLGVARSTLPAWLGAHDGVRALRRAALAARLVAAARGSGRALGQAYARKQLSELGVLFTAVWGISLLDKALGAARDLHWAAP